MMSWISSKFLNSNKERSIFHRKAEIGQPEITLDAVGPRRYYLEVGSGNQSHHFELGKSTLFSSSKCGNSEQRMALVEARTSFENELARVYQRNYQCLGQFGIPIAKIQSINLHQGTITFERSEGGRSKLYNFKFAEASVHGQARTTKEKDQAKAMLKAIAEIGLQERGIESLYNSRLEEFWEREKAKGGPIKFLEFNERYIQARSQQGAFMPSKSIFEIIKANQRPAVVLPESVPEGKPAKAEHAGIWKRLGDLFRSRFTTSVGGLHPT